MYLTVMRTTRTSQKHFILINILLLSYICTCFGSPPISKLQKLTVHMSGKCFLLFEVPVAVHYGQSYSLLQLQGHWFRISIASLKVIFK